jgi:hypothetical protein
MELRFVKGTRRQIGQDSWKPTGVLGKGSSFSFRGSPYSGKNSDDINWPSRRVGNSDMGDLNCSVRFDSARFDSIQHDTWNESYNLVSEPSFVDGNNWRLHLTANGGFSVGGPVVNGDLASMGTPECERSLGERGWSLQQREEDEVTESKIHAFLDEKASELKRLQTPLQEELYETSMRSSNSCINYACRELHCTFEPCYCETTNAQPQQITGQSQWKVNWNQKQPRE